VQKKKKKKKKVKSKKKEKKVKSKSAFVTKLTKETFFNLYGFVSPSEMKENIFRIVKKICFTAKQIIFTSLNWFKK
jgi:hypothetical protein